MTTSTFSSRVADRPTLPSATPSPVYVAPPVAPQQPIYVQARPDRSGNLIMALAVLLLAVLAAGAGYVIAQENAPNADEVARYQEIAAQQGYRNGSTTAYETGRQYGRAQQSQLAKYRTAIKNQRAFNRGFVTGKRDGIRSVNDRPRTPRYSGYRGGYSGGYRAPRYSSYGNSDINSAMYAAQNLANRTGAPVDVEIFN